MRKRMMGRTAWGVALLTLALTGAVAGRATAQSSQRPWLGVATQEITNSLREGLDYRGSGVLVTSVVAGSPADRAGIRKGDVLVSFNSRTLDTPSALVDLVRDAKVGQNVSIIVVRDGQRRSLSARLASRSADDGELFDVQPPRAPRAPRTPEAPETPSAPRMRAFEWNGEDFELPDGRGIMTMLGTGMGRARLGVQIQDMNADLGDALGVTGGKGVLVTDVVKDSPAARAGIKGGDVITEVGGRAVDDVSALQRELRDRQGSVAITLTRRGARRTVNPDIGEKPQAMRWESDGSGDRRVIRIPDIRRRVTREMSGNDGNRDDLEQQMRELREELRELRRKLEGSGKN